MTFYVNFPPEVIAATAEAAAVAEEGITVEPDVDLAEKVINYLLQDRNLGGTKVKKSDCFQKHSTILTIIFRQVQTVTY